MRESLAHLRPSPQLLAQYLISCPGCSQPAAVHLDERGPQPVLVRLVCPGACAVEPATALASVTALATPVPLTA